MPVPTNSELADRMGLALIEVEELLREAKGWLDRNVGRGEKLLEVLTAPHSKASAPKRTLTEGDLAWIPGLNDHMVVITEINDTSLKLWDFGRNRGYTPSVVRTYIP